MKTDYQQDIVAFLNQWFQVVDKPPENTTNIVIKTLSQIHSDIVSVLPAQWINEADVLQALQDIGFKAFKTTNDKGETTFGYYLKTK